MPRIIEYGDVLERMHGLGLRCVYPNSGAFAFADDAGAASVGWIGPDDPTLRPEARPLVVPMAPPYAANLAARLIRAWREQVGGVLWLMPVSHWAYELEFGSADWMPGVLRSAGVDPTLLQPRNDAAAIEFVPDDAPMMQALAEQFLHRLAGSDFSIAFPDRRVICRLHHHQQLWWTTVESRLLDELRGIGGR